MKDLEQRLRTALQQVASQVPVDERATPTSELRQPSPARRGRLVLVAAVVLVALALAAAVRVRDQNASPAGAPPSAVYVGAEGRFYDRELDEVGRMHLGPGNTYVSDISADGRVLLVSDRDATVEMDCCGPDREAIYVTDLKGRRQRRLHLDGGVHDNSASWSPDGSKVLFVRRGLFGRLGEGLEGEPGIYIHDLATRTTRPFLLGKDLGRARWSPDGRFVVSFLSDTIVLIDAQSGEVARRIEDGQGPLQFSPDGTKVAYGRVVGPARVGVEIVVLDLETDVVTPIPRTRTRFSLVQVWGPDGILVRLNRGGGRFVVGWVDEESLSLRVVRHCSSDGGVFSFNHPFFGSTSAINQTTSCPGPEHVLRRERTRR
ncbi:MAG: hypothetical protein M3394_03090 [Actinomycetota bacterium]|nr:hypothetical protein [Actinomycetota bacterium]